MDDEIIAVLVSIAAIVLGFLSLLFTHIVKSPKEWRQDRAIRRSLGGGVEVRFVDNGGPAIRIRKRSNTQDPRDVELRTYIANRLRGWKVSRVNATS